MNTIAGTDTAVHGGTVPVTLTPTGGLATIIDGLQAHGRLSTNTSVLATAKHFLGDGGTRYGSSTNGSYTIDQGATYATQQQVDALFLAPYKTGVDKGVEAVMPSFCSLQILGKASTKKVRTTRTTSRSVSTPAST